MLKLQVNHTWPQIGINRTPSRLEVKSPGYTLDMSVTHAQVRVEAKLPRITIDQSQCFAEAGRKGNADLTAEMVRIAKGAMLSSIARIVDQGNQLANIPNAVNAIPDQGYSNAFEQFDKEFNMATIPTSRPRIEVIEGSLNIQVEEGRVTNRTVPKPVSLSYTRGSVEVYLKQRGSLEVSFVDLKG